MNIYSSNPKNPQASASQKSPRIIVDNPSLVQSSSMDKKVKHNVKNTYIKKINSLINITKAAEEGEINRFFLLPFIKYSFIHSTILYNIVSTNRVKMEETMAVKDLTETNPWKLFLQKIMAR